MSFQTGESMPNNNKLLAKAYRKIQSRNRDVVGFAIFFILTLPVLGLAGYLSMKLASELILGKKTIDYAALGELLLVIVIGVGEFIAFLELRYVARDRDFHTWLKAQDVWMEKEFVQRRGLIFKRLNDLNAPWSDEETREAKETCRKLDEFAHLAPFLGVKKVLAVWDDPLAKAWIVLQNVVEKERENTKWGEKWMGFSTIGQEALDKVVAENRDPRQQNSKSLQA
jgi:hypothetical protein